MIQTRPHAALTPGLQAMIDEFGARRVIFAVLFALLRPRATAGLPEIDDHMRRDMGLPPRAASPPELPQSLRHLW